MPGHPPRLHLVTPAIVERTLVCVGLPGVLSDEERATYEGLTVERRRRDWLAGRIAAKRALRRATRERGELPPPYRAITVRNAGNGAPEFSVDGRADIARDLNVSIAHTDGTAVAAVARTARSGTVGVDIEPTRPLPLALARYVLRPSEAELLSDDDRPHPTPLVIWTVKEAALKAARDFCTSMRDIELRWDDACRLGARVAGARAPVHTLTVAHRATGRYTIALALCR